MGVSPVFRQRNQQMEKEPVLALMDQVLEERQPKGELIPEVRKDPPEASNPSPATQLCPGHLPSPSQHEGYSSYFIKLCEH